MDKTSGIGSTANISRVVESTARIAPDIQRQDLDVIEAMMKDLHTLRVKDIDQQLLWRPRVLKFTALIIILQYAVVFGIVFYALHTGKMKGLSLVFSTLVGGTLLQSALIARIMVGFLFKGIDYKYDDVFKRWTKSKK